MSRESLGFGALGSEWFFWYLSLQSKFKTWLILFLLFSSPTRLRAGSFRVKACLGVSQYHLFMHGPKSGCFDVQPWSGVRRVSHLMIRRQRQTLHPCLVVHGWRLPGLKIDFRVSEDFPFVKRGVGWWPRRATWSVPPPSSSRTHETFWGCLWSCIGYIFINCCRWHEISQCSQIWRYGTHNENPTETVTEPLSCCTSCKRWSRAVLRKWRQAAYLGHELSHILKIETIESVFKKNSTCELSRKWACQCYNFWVCIE